MSTLLSVSKRVRRVTTQKTMCEFFAGIGLVGEGLRASGWECIYANDNEPKKQALYESLNGPSPHFHLEDVGNTAEILSRLPNSSFLATASFPCIDLSLAGNYRGIKGVHSSTFFGFANVLKELGTLRPKVVLLENVFGFIASHDGRDFTEVAQTLATLGYWLDSFVLDARYFLPQSRPRVFVVGVHESILPSVGRTMETKIVRSPEKGGTDSSDWNRSDSPMRPERLQRTMRSTELATGWQMFQLPQLPKSTACLSDVIDLDADQEWWTPLEVRRHYKMLSDLHRNRIDEIVSEGASFAGTGFRRIRAHEQRLEVRFDGLAGCLRTPKGGSAKQIIIAVANGHLRMRWMSPLEYARLQGVGRFPMTTGTRNQLLWGFGDAVCVPAITWIDKHILTPVFNGVTSNNKKTR